VGVRVWLGVNVGVRVKVLVDVLVGVRVDVLVAETTGVAEVVWVGEGGGAVTVNVPPFRLSETRLASGSEATALLGVSDDAPGAAEGLTLNEIVARVPSGIAALPPRMTIRTTPADGWDQLSVFPADEAALPIVTPPKDRRVESNATSNWIAETWVPASESSEAAIPTPEAPGAPDPEPMDNVALPVWAAALKEGRLPASTVRRIARPKCTTRLPGRWKNVRRFRNRFMTPRKGRGGPDYPARMILTIA
jgi:hypothetical protein